MHDILSTSPRATEGASASPAILCIGAGERTQAEIMAELDALDALQVSTNDADLAEPQTPCAQRDQASGPASSSVSQTTPSTPTPHTPSRTHTRTPSRLCPAPVEGAVRRPHCQARIRSSRTAGRALLWTPSNEERSLAALLRSCRLHGGPAFSLNLSTRRAASYKGRADAAKRFGEEVGRQLRAHGIPGVPFVTVFDVEPKTGRLHVHGSYVAGEADPALIHAALIAAGGRIAGPAARFQLRHNEFTCPDGWAAYARKARVLVRRVLGIDAFMPITYRSRSLVRLVKGALGLNRPVKGPSVPATPPLSPPGPTTAAPLLEPPRGRFATVRRIAHRQLPAHRARAGPDPLRHPLDLPATHLRFRTYKPP